MDQPAWQIWGTALIGGALATWLNGWIEAVIAVIWLVWVVPPITAWLQQRTLRLVRSNLRAHMVVIRWSVWLVTLAMIVLFRDWNVTSLLRLQ